MSVHQNLVNVQKEIMGTNKNENRNIVKKEHQNSIYKEKRKENKIKIKNTKEKK